MKGSEKEGRKHGRPNYTAKEKTAGSQPTSADVETAPQTFKQPRVFTFYPSYLSAFVLDMVKLWLFICHISFTNSASSHWTWAYDQWIPSRKLHETLFFLKLGVPERHCFESESMLKEQFFPDRLSSHFTLDIPQQSWKFQEKNVLNEQYQRVWRRDKQPRRELSTEAACGNTLTRSLNTFCVAAEANSVHISTP